MIYPPVDHFPGVSPWVFHIFLEQFTPGDLRGSAKGLDHGRANSRASLHPTDTHQLPGAECLGKQLLDCCRLRELPIFFFSPCSGWKLCRMSNSSLLISQEDHGILDHFLFVFWSLAQTQSKKSELCWWSQTSWTLISCQMPQSGSFLFR